MKPENKNTPIVWLQLSAGQGPKECGWVIAQLSKVILRSAENNQLQAQIIEQLAFDKLLRKQDVIEADAFLSILIRVSGKTADEFTQRWQGTVQWHGESPYRPKHKRINWFVGVSAITMPSSNTIDMHTLQQQVNIDTMRSRGPGGQHVNKTNSAVRITHKVSGLQVRADSDRSQHRNKKLALERLQFLLAQQHYESQKGVEKDRWLQHYDIKRGNPIHRFSGASFTQHY